MLEDMERKTASPGVTHFNYSGRIQDMSADRILVETELFPRPVLEYYTGKNLDLLQEERNPHHARLTQEYFNPERGGAQGDYSSGIQPKIHNVLDCLQKFPASKRAILTLPYSEITSTQADHTVDAEAKCLRELHFYLTSSSREGGVSSPAIPLHELLPSLQLTPSSNGSESRAQQQRQQTSGDLDILNCTGLMRANAAIIFPKNIHFIGAVLHCIASELGVRVGSYTHFVTHLVSDRS